MKKIYVVQLFLVVLMFVACSPGTFEQVTRDVEARVGNVLDANNPYVQSIQNSYLSEFSNEITVGEAFDTFFTNTTWRHFEADTGENIVEFTGGLTYHDAPVTARLQFVISDDGETFEIGAMSFNEVPQSILLTNATIMTAYEFALGDGGREAEITEIPTQDSSSTPQAPASQASPEIDSAPPQAEAGWINLGAITIPSTWGYDDWSGLEIWGEVDGGTIMMMVHWESNEDIELLRAYCAARAYLEFDDGNSGEIMFFGGANAWVNGNRVLHLFYDDLQITDHDWETIERVALSLTRNP